MVLLERCLRCLMDIYYNLAGGNKGLELERGFGDIDLHIEMVTRPGK